MRKALLRFTQHDFLLLAAALLISFGAAGLRTGWRALWATPDQRGAWLLARGRFDAAADAFANPVWRGVAMMRAGHFQDASDSFAAADTAVAAYDRGNALVMLGQYPEAVLQYDHALALRLGWPDAIANRALAQRRADQFARLHGELADEESAAVDEAYRRDRLRASDSQQDGPSATVMSNEAIHALWLRRVQTRPADFLRARFAYQLQQQTGNSRGASPQ